MYIIYTTGTVLEEISKTYLVHAVVCQRTKSKLPFHEAVQRGVIDKDSGAYLHNVTGEKFFVVDAINKGQCDNSRRIYRFTDLLGLTRPIL